MKDRTVRTLSNLHRIVYRATRGAVGRRLVDNDMLLLTTMGRITGRPHTVPLLYLMDGPDRFVVIASYGGRPDHPSWYLNLLEERRVMVQVRGEQIAATAQPAGVADRKYWWQRAVEAYQGYAAYAARTDREIPIVFIDRVQQDPTS